MKTLTPHILRLIVCVGTFALTGYIGDTPKKIPLTSERLRLVQDPAAQTISVFRGSNKKPILVQTAKADFRPFIHPIQAPDGKGVLTEYSPGHHKHQTGLYWGYTRVNGRDYFHHPQGDYWRRKSAKMLTASGPTVKWETVYDLLDSTGKAVLTETQIWSMRSVAGPGHERQFLLDLEWQGEAQTDVTIGKYDYGGLFLRMPWREGIKGEVMNAARQRNNKAEGQRAMWVDAGMQVEGRSDLAHIAIFDHPENKGYPQTWRVDSQLGIGPARARTGDWTIKKGDTEVIRHQLVVYTGVLNDVELTKTWGQFSGVNSIAALWGIAQREGRDAKFLNPDEAVKAMTVMPGFAVNTWASEPMMTQPMAFCWDDRGRLWVAENLDYESRGYGFSKAGNSRILILEDTDHDGKADSRKVFLDSIPFPSAIAVGFDGLFLGAPPNLLFVPDRNHDDKGDMADIEVRLTGWGIRDRHETLNSFHWGPDGWLYGLQGFATPSIVRKPDGKGKLYKKNDPFPEEEVMKGKGVEINGGVWRYHPTKDRFEVVAHGFSNPWGIDYDAKGQLVMTACVIPHLWHVVPGGIYHRQGGQHFNPYVYSDIKTIADHSHRSAHGGARVYLSDAFPKAHQGRIFMANIHEHAILSDVLKPKGSGFTGHHGDELLTANNAQWVGFSMELGPEGGLYVLDWHDADICGKEVLNGETGRIFRVMPTKSEAQDFPNRYADLSKLTDRQLVEMQAVTSDWHARRARLVLQHRAVSGKLNADTHAQLRTLFEAQSNADWRLRAFWALHVTGGLSSQTLLTALTDRDAHVRAWAVQLSCEDKPSAKMLAQFARMARADASPVVRLYLASALQRLKEDDRWAIAEPLLTHAEDANDHNLPKMIWLGVEPLVAKQPDRALVLAGSSKIPMVAQFIARRAADANEMGKVVAAIGQLPPARTAMLEGLRDGLEGRANVTAPANWKVVQAKLIASDATTVRLAGQVSQQFGDTETMGKSIAAIRDKKAPIETRRQALQLLATRQRPELAAELPALLQESGLRADAIRAVASFDNESLGKLVLTNYPSFNATEKGQAVQTLASRPKYGWLLTQAIKDKTVPKRDVPSYAARQLLRVVGSGFVEVWGPIEHNGMDEKAYAKYQRMANNKAVSEADAVAGRLVFGRSCGPCHKMYGEGGVMGPELTGSNRANLDYLLFNILNPSGEIQDDYKMVVVTTRDGRTYTGNVASENERQVRMRVVGQDIVVLNKSDIQSREVTPVSMMPTGLLETLTDKEVVDLVAFMRTVEPVKSAKSMKLSAGMNSK